MSFNQVQVTVIKTVNKENIKKVDNFKYLGAWIDDTANDVKVRKALALKSCNKLNKIWKLPRCKSLKLQIFLTLVESVLLCGSETLALTKRTIFNASWSDQLTNRELYSNFPKVTKKIRERRLKLAEHCVRHSEEVASNLVLWKPSHGKPNRGRKRKTYLDNLMNDTNMETVD